MARPRLFQNGTRTIATSVPEDDARLVEYIAVRSGRTVANVIATALWREIEHEGLTPTWGVPDALRSGPEGRAATSADDGTDHPRGPRELSHPAMDRAALHP